MECLQLVATVVQIITALAMVLFSALLWKVNAQQSRIIAAQHAAALDDERGRVYCKSAKSYVASESTHVELHNYGPLPVIMRGIKIRVVGRREITNVVERTTSWSHVGRTSFLLPGAEEEICLDMRGNMDMVYTAIGKASPDDPRYLEMEVVYTCRQQDYMSRSAWVFDGRRVNAGDQEGERWMGSGYVSDAPIKVDHQQYLNTVR